MKELLFFGKVTAGVTHEMKNVLAIIRESAGLMGDLLSLSEQASFPHRERFQRAISTIRDQVDRGVEWSNRLNRFAHSPDEEEASLDVLDVANQVMLLSERFARLNNVNLKAKAREGSPVRIVSSPYGLRMALFMGLEYLWTQLPAGGAITVTAEGSERKAVICMTCDSMIKPWDDLMDMETVERRRRLCEAVSELGGQAVQTECGLELIFNSNARTMDVSK